MLAMKGTRQNRSILHAKADMKSQLFAKNAEMSRVFRRFPGSRLRPKKDHTRKGSARRFSATMRRTLKIMKISHLCRRHPLLRVYFYISLAGSLISPMGAR
jgi:hypothetical protein